MDGWMDGVTAVGGGGSQESQGRVGEESKGNKIIGQ